jgi:hypothetical protein
MKCHVFLLCYLLITVCLCFGEKVEHTADRKNADILNVTLSEPNVLFGTTAAKEPLLINDTLKTNTSLNKVNTKELTGTEKQTASELTNKDLMPIPIMVASPAVAIAIFIFICVAYKWHTIELDAEAKEFAAQLGSVHCPSPCIPCSPHRYTQRLLPPSSQMQSSYLYHSDSDLLGARRNLLHTPPQIFLSPPRGLDNFKASSLSALSDQEVINQSSRRHSTFLL